METIEGGRQGPLLEPPHGWIVHVRAAADPLQVGAIRREVIAGGHIGDAEINRIDRHRAHRGVRRLLTGRHLVQGEQLEDALSRAGEPRRHGSHVADVSDAPARGRWKRKQRNEKTGAPASERHCLISRGAPPPLADASSRPFGVAAGALLLLSRGAPLPLADASPRPFGVAAGALSVQSKCRKRRVKPSPKCASGTSRLMTRNDSRTKSKK